MLEEWFEQWVRQTEKNAKYSWEYKILQSSFLRKFKHRLKFKQMKQVCVSSMVCSELLSHLIHDSSACEIVWATLPQAQHGLEARDTVKTTNMFCMVAVFGSALSHSLS